ncbi:hypothetical protein [Neptunicoccus sediminis]|uniref:hypothetical protein n=1 Tax=Neptunicoccus sediminis TaxID=1892596 RepID=UPI00084609EF|nr:hypothetical protein [Neptunicoccus sediminis]
MEQFKKDISQMLATAVSPTNVVPLVNKEETSPTVVFSFRNGQREIFYKDSFGLAEAELVADVYADSYSKLANLTNQIETAFHAFSGTTGTTNIHKMEIVNKFETTSFDGNLFRTIIQIRILM